MSDNLLYENKFINPNIDNQHDSYTDEDSDEYSDDSSNDYSDDSDHSEDLSNLHNQGDFKNKKKVKKIKESFLLIINSKDRYWDNILDSNLDTFKYQVKFAPTMDSGVFSGQSKMAHFVKNYKDIVSVEFSHVILPNIYLDLKLLHCMSDTKHKLVTSSKVSTKNSRALRIPKLSDLPYICMIVDEIGSTSEGTNKLLNTSTSILIPDDIRFQTNNNSGSYYSKALDSGTVNAYEFNNIGHNVIADTGSELIKFINIVPWRKEYFPNPKNSLNLLSISFLDPEGKPLKLLDDYLDIKSVGLVHGEDTGEILELVSNTYNITDSNLWLANQTNVSVTAFTTNDKIKTGKDATFTISTNSDGSSVTIKIIDGGIDFDEGDFIKLIDPADPTSLTKIAYFFVKKVTGEMISLETSNYFSPEEYKIGSRILIKNLSMKNIDYYDSQFVDSKGLETFLNREEGHIIGGLGESSVNTSSTCDMFNQIQIPPEYSINLNTGTSSISSDFNLHKNEEAIIPNAIPEGFNTTDQVVLRKTTDLDYYNVPLNKEDYYNGKQLIFRSGVNDNVKVNITDYSVDTSNNLLIAKISPLLNLPAESNDKYRIELHSETTSGRLINMNLQNIISFKLTTEKADNSIFKNI